MYYTLATLIRIWLQEPLVRIKGFHGLVCKVAWKLQGKVFIPIDCWLISTICQNNYSVLIIVFCFCQEF